MTVKAALGVDDAVDGGVRRVGQPPHVDLLAVVVDGGPDAVLEDGVVGEYGVLVAKELRLAMIMLSEPVPTFVAETAAPIR